MIASQAAKTSTAKSEVAFALRHLQDQTLLLALPGLFFAGTITLQLAGKFQSLPQGVLTSMALVCSPAPGLVCTRPGVGQRAVLPSQSCR